MTSKKSDQEILAYIRAQGNPTTREISDYTFSETTYAYCKHSELTNTYKRLKRLKSDGSIISVKTGPHEIRWMVVA